MLVFLTMCLQTPAPVLECCFAVLMQHDDDEVRRMLPDPAGT
jgi:hypothetical protein